MEKEKWYNNGSIITTLIIVVIFAIILASQSFAIGTTFSLTLLGSVINHNSTYLFVLMYFILLKFSFGKKYFNYLSLILIFLYGISTITSLLTLVGAFSLDTVLEFAINFTICAYLIHTMLRGTILWKEFRLGNSPFNEFTNDGSFYIVIVLSVFLLIVKLISTVELKGVCISILDCIYVILLGKYIFLYRKYLDQEKIDFINEGNFDEVRKVVDDSIEVVKDKTEELLDKTDIDEKLIEVKDKAVKKSKKVVKDIKKATKNTTKKGAKK